MIVHLKRTIWQMVNRPLKAQVGVVGTENKNNRTQWLEKTLRDIPAGSRILDAGAGQLQYKPLCSHLQYVGQDFGQYDGEGDQVGLQVGKWNQSKLDIVCDIADIPEPDESFDAIMCIEVLEHLPHPVEALREFQRLLRPKGRLILTAPFCSLTHYAPFFYQTGYSRYFYEYWLTELNFDIQELTWNGNYFEYLAQEILRLPQVCRDYADSGLRWHEKIAQQIMLGALNRFSLRNRNSEDLLAFGVHVVAKKR